MLFLTARCGDIDRVMGLELGADDYIDKPFSPRELVARVRTTPKPKYTTDSSRCTAGPRYARYSTFKFERPV